MHKTRKVRRPLLVYHNRLKKGRYVNALNIVTLLYLDHHLLDAHVVDHDCIAPGALAEAALGGPGAAHAHASGEGTRTIGNQLHSLEVAWVEGVGGISHLLLKALVQTPLVFSTTIQFVGVLELKLLI